MATPIIDSRGYQLVPEAPIDPQAFTKGAALAQMISGRKQQAADAEKQRYGGILAQLLRAGSEEEYNAMLNNFSQMNQDPDILSDLNYLGQIGMGEGMNVAESMLRGYGMETFVPGYGKGPQQKQYAPQWRFDERFYEEMIDGKSTGRFFNREIMRDTNMGETSSRWIPIGGGDYQPDPTADMRLRSPKGLTAEDEANAAMLISGAKKSGEIDAEVSGAEDIAAAEEKIAFSKESGKLEAQERAEYKAGALGKMNAFNNQLRTMDKAIDALKNNAETGYIAQYLPTWRQSTIKLQEALKEMGIERINSATFGALSEKELGLALSIDIPENMNEDDLLVYLEEKRAAMQKLAEENRKLYKYMSEGGTIAGWMDLQEKEYGNPEKKAYLERKKAIMGQ